MSICRRGETLIDPEFTPWFKHYGNVPYTIKLPETNLYGILKDTASKYPNKEVYEFMGSRCNYSQMLKDVDNFASSLYSIGVRKGMNVLICMPNCPQCVIAFYAVSRLDAISVMVHPLSAKKELEYYVEYADCDFVVTLDMFYSEFPHNSDKRKFIVSSMADYLPKMKSILYKYVIGRKDPKIKAIDAISWKDMMHMPYQEPPASDSDSTVAATILFTGGTTGKSKGAVLSSDSLTSTAMGMAELSQAIEEGETMMAVMPMFHGFGLCACVHLPICYGKRFILVPKFTPDSYAKLIVKQKPNFIAGVPTLYEHMIRSKWLKNADLSCLKGIFCGGDSLSIDTKKRVDAFLSERNCSTVLREGYGTTETTTANTINPKHMQKEGSVGVPMPNLLFKIVKPGTEERVPFGEDGEICVSGYSMMIKYYNEPEETADTIRIHSDDGIKWVHTGDMGSMDSDGFIYYKQRIKRIIITSGYNVYPIQIENALRLHPAVEDATVIGVPDEIRGQKVKAFVILSKGYEAGDEMIEELKRHMKENVAAYAKPRIYSFIDTLPRTKVAKVDYTALENIE